MYGKTHRNQQNKKQRPVPGPKDNQPISAARFPAGQCAGPVRGDGRKGRAYRRPAEARSLASLIAAAEKDVYFRDRLPDLQTPFTNAASSTVSLFDWDFPALIQSAAGTGSFGTKGMPANFSTHTTVPSAYSGMPVAIIGAGASGLVAGYELMKLGFVPHFYEMQVQDNPSAKPYARPYGRSFSWDYGGNGKTTGQRPDGTPRNP